MLLLEILGPCNFFVRSSKLQNIHINFVQIFFNVAVVVFWVHFTKFVQMKVGTDLYFPKECSISKYMVKIFGPC